MRKHIILLLVAGALSNSYATDIKPPISLCTAVKYLEKRIRHNPCAPDLLMTMGEMAQKIEIDPETFQKDPQYKQQCHLKIVKSENFGDFVSYSGYHYTQLLKQYPESKLADDAAYALIYIITDDTYNFSDTRIEKKKLLDFLKQYPKSNKSTEAKARIKEIDEALTSGQSAILD